MICRVMLEKNTHRSTLDWHWLLTLVLLTVLTHSFGFSSPPPPLQSVHFLGVHCLFCFSFQLNLSQFMYWASLTTKCKTFMIQLVVQTTQYKMIKITELFLFYLWWIMWRVVSASFVSKNN